MKHFISEDDIERACIEVCTDNLGYKTFNCMNQDYLNRKSEREVLYEYRIKLLKAVMALSTISLRRFQWLKVSASPA